MNELADLREVDLTHAVWRTSSYTAGNGNCVEVTPIPGISGIAVRDSKNREYPAARFTEQAWAAFIAAAVDDTLTS
ncbi:MULTISPECIES: DUF397 domain-containing protein [Streptomyces violaceusniger group]|uniref:DUF397 domain-containing protein n=1 Tax=Streptomyces rhizosphaericus TaxID=114699 RepID=A0ABN1PVL7_9ACTN|nr:DUF397 domain-containing protein [Streptomyces cangkringensis]